MMNFKFSDELIQLRDQTRRFLADRCRPSVPRCILDTDEPYAGLGLAFRDISTEART